MRNSRLFKCMTTFILLYLAVVGTHKLWLPLFAEYLIVKAPLKKCDLIVVSTGSYTRFLYAIDLMKKDYAGKLLLLGDERFKNVSDSKTPLQMATEEALGEKIPVESLYSRSSTSTLDDARIAKKLLLSQGLKSAIVISDRYNMKRLSMIFNDTFRGTSVDLVYTYNEQDDGLVAPDHWWKSSPTFLYVVKEWIKFPLDLFAVKK